MPTEDYGKWMRAFTEDSTGSDRLFDELARGLSGESISRDGLCGWPVRPW